MPLAELGAGLGYRVTVVDDRPSYANRDHFPTASKIICQDFNNSFDILGLNSFSFVSRRKVQYIKGQLIAEGQSELKLNKVHAPIGIDIGAVTPGEISISIMAQIISARRTSGFFSATLTTVKIWPELDLDVIWEMAINEGKSGALVSVVHSTGSVPRKTGAKMFVQPDGKITGSIGGGTIEAMAIREAIMVMETGGYRYKCLDINGELSENDGMICGGSIGVVIESCN